MDYSAVIQSSLKYIEENLLTDVSPQELADQAGFSLYHYYRLFHGAVGMPVKQYILRRKIQHALHEIKAGLGMTAAALRYKG